MIPTIEETFKTNVTRDQAVAERPAADVRRSMMKFYDLRKRLCEERDLTDLQCSGPGDDTVQITAFTRKIDPPPPSTTLTPSPFTRNTTGPLKLVMPKFDNSNHSLKTSHVAHSCDSSPTSDFDSDSDSGERS